MWPTAAPLPPYCSCGEVRIVSDIRDRCLGCLSLRNDLMRYFCVIFLFSWPAAKREQENARAWISYVPFGMAAVRLPNSDSSYYAPLTSAPPLLQLSPLFPPVWLSEKSSLQNRGQPLSIVHWLQHHLGSQLFCQTPILRPVSLLQPPQQLDISGCLIIPLISLWVLHKNMFSTPPPSGPFFLFLFSMFVFQQVILRLYGVNIVP